VSTSALVERTMLLDLGPDTARAAQRLGVALDAVRHVLVTHAHPDHWAPQALLWHRWAPTTRPLEVLGPADVVEEARHWVGDDSDVRLTTLRAGDVVERDGTVVRALAADHEVPCLLYDLTTADGARLLYATDTGRLPEPTLAALSGARLDLLLLELTFGTRDDHGTGHLDLHRFPRVLADLRSVGALHPASRVLAVHLGHHNPPEPELAARLAPWGAEPGQDGQHLRLPARPGADDVGWPGDRPHRTLLLGGARSGKSQRAEAMLAAEPEVVYVATARSAEADEEWQARVRRHQERRPAGWRTVETVDLEPLLREPGPPLLVDCLTLWLTAVLDDAAAWDRWDGATAATVRGRVEALVAAWVATPRRVVAVSNEVGSGVVPATASGRLFRDELGRLNAALAAASDRVDLVVAGVGVPLRPTGGSPG
jgi:adenosylcobinamide kinase/adenosylcobinamide-phosphate guanylyltransferase